jgi:hypothetical protein
MKQLPMMGLSLVLLISLISCRENNSERILKTLQGDWISTVEDKYFISFRDSTYFNGDQYEEFEQLIFRNDSIFTDNGYLYLSDARITARYLWGYNEELKKEIPSLKNTRIYQDENIKLKSLEVRFVNFWLRGLTDWALYLNEDLDCFLKVENTNINKRINNPLPYPEGLYYSKISPSDFEFFQEKFQNIPLSKVKKEYRSEDYSTGSSCVGPFDRTQLLFKCRFGFKDRDEIKTLFFHVRGFRHALPGHLSALIFHLNKIHDFINFGVTDKLHPFEFYSPDYKDYFHNKEIAWLRDKDLLVEFEMTEDSVLRLMRYPKGLETFPD